MSSDDSDPQNQLDVIEVIRSMLEESGSLGRFMEVYYLASEPDLFAIMRAVASLKGEDRRALAEFIRTAAEDGLRIKKGGKNDSELILESRRNIRRNN